VVLEDSVAPFDFHEAVRSLIRNQEFDDTHLDVCPLPNEALPVTRLVVARIPKQNHCVNGFSLLKERFVKAYAKKQAPTHRPPISSWVVLGRPQGVRIQLGHAQSIEPGRAHRC